MSILGTNGAEKGGGKPSHLNLMKIFGPVIFTILMAASINSFAQTDKKVNYGGVKDSLKTYLADCFIKEIMLKNSPARIRSTLAYIVDKKITGNEAADYLLGKLILQNDADNMKCENQDLNTSVGKQELSQSNTPVSNDTTSSKKVTVANEEKKDETVVKDNMKSEALIKEENTEKRREEIREERRKEAVAKDDRKSDQGSGEQLYECDLPYQTAESYGWCRITDSYELAKSAGIEDYTGTAEQNIHIQRFIIEKNLRKK